MNDILTLLSFSGIISWQMFCSHIYNILSESDMRRFVEASVSVMFALASAK